MNVSLLLPLPQDRVGFALYALSRIPDGSGCYCLTNASGDVLYVGQAISIKRRLIQHFESSKRNEKTAHGRISLAWWLVTAEASLSALERGWIESVRLADGQLPPLNRVGAPI